MKRDNGPTKMQLAVHARRMELAAMEEEGTLRPRRRKPQGGMGPDRPKEWSWRRENDTKLRCKDEKRERRKRRREKHRNQMSSLPLDTQIREEVYGVVNDRRRTPTARSLSRDAY
jgi:hypothetical protein